MRDPPEGARPEELPGPHILLPAEGQSRLHAARPAAAADVHGGVGGVRVRSMLGLGAISPFLEKSGAVHDGADVGERQTRRAPGGQVCAGHDFQQGALDHESVERSGTAATAAARPVVARRFRHNAAAADHPECQRRARAADSERPLQLRPAAVHRTASGTIFNDVIGLKSKHSKRRSRLVDYILPYK